jgi:hypothetical protein
MSDLEQDGPATPRREFLGQLAVSAAALAAAGCATPAAASSLAATTRRAPSAWDDSWFGRLTSKHKAVFDNPELESSGTIGMGVTHTLRYLSGMREALGVTDAQTVLVIRHEAIPLAFNDTIWAKYGVGEYFKVKAPGVEGGWAMRNPVATPNPGRATPSDDRPQANLAWLAAHGHILLGCDVATNRLAGQLATHAHADRAAVYEELKQNVVTGLILQPNGVYAVHRAQEAGCTVIHSV